MTTTDYLINAVLVLLVFRQMTERKLDRRALVLPVVLCTVVANSYLHAIPTAGNDLVLIGALTAIGLTLGFLSAHFTSVRVGDDGVALARAGYRAAAFWVLGMGARMAFVFASTNGAGSAIHSFSASAHITGSQAWVAAFVLMALAEVAARIATLYSRGYLVRGSRQPVLSGAQA